MKRLLVLLLIAALCLAGCGGDARAEESTAAVSAESQTALLTEPSASSSVPDGTEVPDETQASETSVLVADENCAFAFLGTENNDYTGLALLVECSNSSGEDLIFSWEAVSVCGYMYDPGWSQEVPAGETVESRVSIDTFALEDWGIFTVDEVSFRLHIYGSESWMDEPYVDESFTIYPTGLGAEEVVFPERESVNGETVLVDNDALAFVIEYADTGDAVNYLLRCYMENRTDAELLVCAEDISANSVPLSAVLSVVLAPGKRAYADIAIPRSELEENGIASVAGLTFSLLVSDYESGETLLEQAVGYTPAGEEPMG